LSPGIPAPSDSVLTKLASIAAQVEDILAPENPGHKTRVGLSTVKNDRRRTMEAVLVLLADPELRSYIAELERLGLI